MRNLGTRWSLAICMTAAVLLTSCSSNPTAPKVALTDPGAPPDTYPPIPRPSTSPREVTPDTSESYYAIVPIDGKQVDFAPTWSEGVFTWHIDVQTQHRIWGRTDWVGYPPAPYWDGNTRNTKLVFENGQVDLKWPDPVRYYDTRRLQFVKAGNVVDSPANPDLHDDTVVFDWLPWPNIDPNYRPTLYHGSFAGSKYRAETKYVRALYQVVAQSCAKLTNPVFLKRQRFWERVYLNNGSLKSVIIDPGATYSVTYTRLQGVDDNVSHTFTKTISAEVNASTPADIADAKLGGSLSDAFATSVTGHSETSTNENQTFNGKDGQTVVYSVWRSVERHTFVDKDGNPYTDPNFTFVDLGTGQIVGDLESLVSTSFPYGSAPQTSAMKSGESISRLNPKGVAR